VILAVPWEDSVRKKHNQKHGIKKHSSKWKRFNFGTQILAMLGHRQKVYDHDPVFSFALLGVTILIVVLDRHQKRSQDKT
jgi:hypothetical protein